MEELNSVLTTVTIFGQQISFNANVFYMTWLVMIILTILGFLATRKLKPIPSKLQNCTELIYDFLKDITYASLGKEDGKKYLGFVITIFLFVLLANWIGVLPGIFGFIGTVIALIHKAIGTENIQFVGEGITSIKMQVSDSLWYSFLLNIPGFEEPTRSINTDLALGLSVFFVVHAFGIKNKGIGEYLASYLDPFPAKFPYVLFFFLNPFLYLNIIGTVSNIVSQSFRLFGNIFGGFMIVAIVSSLIKYVFIPVGLNAFFGLFAGLVQAFVFTMLTVTYLAQQK